MTDDISGASAGAPKPVEISEAQLFRMTREGYPDRFGDHLVEQYKLYVQSHEKISERREGSNQFFLALNSAVVGGIVFLWQSDAASDALIVGANIAAIAMCFFWFRSIRSYDHLNTGKFRIIHAIERRLPLALYETEWQTLGEGQAPRFYKPISHLERSIPIAFATLYVAIIIARLSQVAI